MSNKWSSIRECSPCLPKGGGSTGVAHLHSGLPTTSIKCDLLNQSASAALEPLIRKMLGTASGGTRLGLDGKGGAGEPLSRLR